MVHATRGTRGGMIFGWIPSESAETVGKIMARLPYQGVHLEGE